MACGESEPCHVFRHAFRRCLIFALQSSTVFWAIFPQIVICRRDAVYKVMYFHRMFFQLALWSAMQLEQGDIVAAGSHKRSSGGLFVKEVHCLIRLQCLIRSPLQSPYLKAWVPARKNPVHSTKTSNVTCLRLQPSRCDPICESVPRRFTKPLYKNRTILQRIGCLALCSTVVKKWMVM